jgi:hypothetical protein
MSGRRVTAMLLSGVVALTAAGAARGGLAPAAYRKAANASCPAANARLQRPRPIARNLPAATVASEAFDWNIATLRREYAALHALRPAGGVVSVEHQLALDDLHQLIRVEIKVQRRIRAGVAPYTAVTSSFATMQRLFVTMTETWQAAGLTVCGSNAASFSLDLS